jgi:hypothetical protein
LIRTQLLSSTECQIFFEKRCHGIIRQIFNAVIYRTSITMEISDPANVLCLNISYYII